MVPRSRPQIHPAEAKAILLERGIASPVALIGIRGYYLDTMGVPGSNDRGIYDDAIVLVGPSYYSTYNANTDPSVARPSIAVLAPGLWWYKPGIHGYNKPIKKRYTALVQAEPVTVIRDHGRRPGQL